MGGNASHIKEFDIYKLSGAFVIEKLTHVNRKANEQKDQKSIITQIFQIIREQTV